ncbi:hypothetical protein RRG08_004420 [Elysia crispata]|uniref:Uncharacterized protein n=1 Tax=Elysia crispata TaxID=231223 RepID=A0AAE1CT45_9GAST|nr:hypothetical protein RRG08_004420 [Elysia crispata]
MRGHSTACTQQHVETELKLYTVPAKQDSEVRVDQREKKHVHNKSDLEMPTLGLNVQHRAGDLFTFSIGVSAITHKTNSFTLRACLTSARFANVCSSWCAGSVSRRVPSRGPLVICLAYGPIKMRPVHGITRPQYRRGEAKLAIHGLFTLNGGNTHALYHHPGSFAYARNGVGVLVNTRNR